jgi:arylsulfatase A-like enzyme
LTALNLSLPAGAGLVGGGPSARAKHPAQADACRFGRRARALLGLAAAALAALGCRGGSPPEPALGVVLVSIDTLRADRLGCYGRRPSLTPSIDAFRQDAVLFEWVIAEAPSTLPSHASIFTSLIPQHHGASVTREMALAPAHLTLTEVLRDRGFSTAAFHGGGQLDAAFGLDQGFEVYKAKGHRPGDASYDRFLPTVEKGLAWLEPRRQGRFLLFLHTYEAHSPYTPSREGLAALDAGYQGPLPAEISTDLLAGINTGQTALAPADRLHIEHAYEAEVHSVDAAFATLVEGLRRLGLYDRTLIVFTSDHGEEFGEHGKVGRHGHTLYDELLRIPLLVKYPHSWRSGQALTAQVRGIDIAPTVLVALGMPVPAVFEGSDLTRYAAGGVPPPPYAVSVLDGGGSSLRSPRWKWDRHALYDLSTDPGERVDVSAAYPRVAERLRRKAEELVAKAATIGPVPATLDPALQERLRALGYLD